MYCQALLAASTLVSALASTNKFFEVRGCSTDANYPSTYTGYRIGYSLNVCIPYEDGSGSSKNVENTDVTTQNGVKIISYDYIDYSTPDCTEPSTGTFSMSYPMDCSATQYGKYGAYVADMPSSGGANGSSLFK